MVLDSVSQLSRMHLVTNTGSIVKETWEPVIEDLFQFDDERNSSPVIREVWGLDCQNHGEACILNEDVLSKKPGVLSKSMYL